jgi:uncharacterized protein YjiS (DUF1127 family)
LFYGYFNVIVPDIQFKFVFSILSLVRALIDYFLYKTTVQVLTRKIDDTHVSDHHPIKLKLIRTLKRKEVELNQQTRTRWESSGTSV